MIFSYLGVHEKSAVIIVDLGKKMDHLHTYIDKNFSSNVCTYVDKNFFVKSSI